MSNKKTISQYIVRAAQAKWSRLCSMRSFSIAPKVNANMITCARGERKAIRLNIHTLYSPLLLLLLWQLKLRKNVCATNWNWVFIYSFFSRRLLLLLCYFSFFRFVRICMDSQNICSISGDGFTVFGAEFLISCRHIRTHTHTESDRNHRLMPKIKYTLPRIRNKLNSILTLSL